MLEENGRINFCDDLLLLADGLVADVETTQGRFDLYERALATTFALLVMRAEIDATLQMLSHAELFEGVDPVAILTQAGIDLEHMPVCTQQQLQDALKQRGLLGIPLD